MERLETRNLLSVNLVQNGDFEAVLSSTTLPAYPDDLEHWFAVNVDGEILVDANRAYEGDTFMSLLQNAGQNPTTDWLGTGWDLGGYDRGGQLISVEPNSSYTVSFAYRGGDGSRAGYLADSLFFQIEEFASDNDAIHSEVIETDGTWRQYSYTFTTDADTESLVILFSAEGTGNTDVWIDDVQLRTAPPKVLNVILSDSPIGSNAAYEFDDGNVGSGIQLKTVPTAVKKIGVQFDKDVDIESGDLDFIALNRVVTEPTVSTFDPPTSGNLYTATWTLSGVLPAAQYLLRLEDSITDTTTDNLQLDGEWTNPAALSTTSATSVFPSGDNIEGGDFEFVFTVLPGDANRDNVVGAGDLALWTSNQNQTNRHWGDGDFTGNGIVDVGDLGVLGSTYNFNFQNLNIRGDYDLDYDVDTDDSDDFYGYYNSNPKHINADINGNGTVAIDDFFAFYSLYNFDIDLRVLN